MLDGLGVRYVHLGHPDALFRRRRDPSGLLRRAGRVLPELDHRYPTFRYDIDLGRVSRGDRELLDLVTAEVADIARGAAVFAPLGVGRHVDHLLARQVGEHLGAVLYADFPYTARDPEGEAVAAGRPAPVGVGRRPARQAVGDRRLPDAGRRAVPGTGRSRCGRRRTTRRGPDRHY